MRLSHPILSSPLLLREDVVPVLVLEDPCVFRKLVFELSEQAAGASGDFTLSQNFEPLDCAEHLHVLRDYLSFPLDDRKLLNRFQSRLQWTIRELLGSETDRLQQEICSYLQSVSAATDWPICFSEGEYILPLLKALRCQPVLDGSSLLERLLQYLELYCGLMKDQCFVLVNAHLYFSARELSELFRMSRYEKWRLLLIEQQLPASLPEESVCLIDAQLCELRLDSAFQTE